MSPSSHPGFRWPESLPVASQPYLWCLTVLTPAFRIAIGSMALYFLTNSSLIGMSLDDGFGRRTRNSGVSSYTHAREELALVLLVLKGFKIPLIGIVIVVMRDIPIPHSTLP
jgi:hypothetical protein